MCIRDRVIIAVEDNKPDAIKILERIAEKDDPDDVSKVMPLRSKYPQGAEKMMISHTLCISKYGTKVLVLLHLGNINPRVLTVYIVRP